MSNVSRDDPSDNVNNDDNASPPVGLGDNNTAIPTPKNTDNNNNSPRNGGRGASSPTLRSRCIRLLTSQVVEATHLIYLYRLQQQREDLQQQHQILLRNYRPQLLALHQAALRQAALHQAALRQREEARFVRDAKVYADTQWNGVKNSAPVVTGVPRPDRVFANPSRYTPSLWVELQTRSPFLHQLVKPGEVRDQQARCAALARAIHQAFVRLAGARRVVFGLMDGVGRILYGTLNELKRTHGWTNAQLDNNITIHLVDLNIAMNDFHEWMLPQNRNVIIERRNACPTTALLNQNPSNRTQTAVVAPFTHTQVVDVMYFNFSQTNLNSGEDGVKKSDLEKGTYVGNLQEVFATPSQFAGVAETTQIMRNRNPQNQTMVSFSVTQGAKDNLNVLTTALNNNGLRANQLQTGRNNFHTYWLV